jgi:hypothetical protein
VIRIEQGEQQMSLMLDYDNAKRLAWNISSELRKVRI